MSGLSVQYSIDRIENGSLTRLFNPNYTTEYNCTSIDCFSEYLSLILKNCPKISFSFIL